MEKNERSIEQEILYNGLKKTIHYYFEMYDKTKNGEKFVKQEYYRLLHIEFGRILRKKDVKYIVRS